jgi:hypothetical protein
VKFNSKRKETEMHKVEEVPSSHTEFVQRQFQNPKFWKSKNNNSELGGVRVQLFETGKWLVAKRKSSTYPSQSYKARQGP